MVKAGQSLYEDILMHVTFELPDELVQRIEAKWHDTLTHYARERLVMEAYRDDL